jgi:hypothetical protein
VATNFIVILSQRQHFGNEQSTFNDIEPAVPFVGPTKDFSFNCPNVDPDETAFLTFQSRDVDHQRNVCQINGVDVFGGLPASPDRKTWNGNILLVEPHHQLRATGNQLHLESCNSSGGSGGDIDDFIIDNVVIVYKTRTARTPNGCYSVKDFGAVGDGSADDTQFIQAAFDAATADNVGAVAVSFPAGTYRLTAPIVIDGVNDLTVSATCGANIDYSALSANGSLVENSVLQTPTAARSALYFKNCARLKIYGLTTTGNSTSNMVNANIGAGIYLRGCNDARIGNCQNFYGGALFQQDATSTDFASVLEACYSFGARNPTVPGPQTTFLGCTWEQPVDADYDRIGEKGSSSACYAFAGRSNCKWLGCLFKNIRIAGIKISGSSVRILNSVVTGCTFLDCGAAIVYGADQPNDQDHFGLIFSNNTCQDCATNRIGWHQDASVVILGSTMTKVLNNTFFYSRKHIAPELASATRGIQITHYRDGTPEVHAVEVAGNTFFTDPSGGTNPAEVINQCLDIQTARDVHIHHNHFQNQVIGIFTVSLVGLIQESNTADNTIRFSQGTSNVTPVYRHNYLLRGSKTSLNPQLISTSDSNPVIEENLELRNTAGEGASIAMTQSVT